MAEISKITVGGVTYDIKDTTARSIALKYVICTEAANTPEGVVWIDNSDPEDPQTITGTLTASAETKGIYLVPVAGTSGKNVHDEYVTVTGGTELSPTYSWEKLGSTEAALKGLVTDVTLNKGNGDNVLGADTTFTNGTSTVTFSGGTDADFVQSYPGVTSKLETATIKGVGENITFNAVSSDPGTVTATNTVFGTDTTASKIETETKTATAVTFDESTTASKATAGTAKDVAYAGTAVDFNGVNSAITNASGEGLVYNMQVNSETLSFSTVATAAKSVTPAVSNGSITPYTFADVTVPVITAHENVSVASVKTNTDVTVPVVSSNSAVTAAGQITLASKTAATAASSASTVATGSLKADDTVGATIMTGLGTATTAKAVTAIGTGTAAAQTITVGTNDTVSAVKYDDLSISVTKKQ